MYNCLIIAWQISHSAHTAIIFFLQNVGLILKSSFFNIPYWEYHAEAAFSKSRVMMQV